MIRPGDVVNSGWAAMYRSEWKLDFPTGPAAIKTFSARLVTAAGGEGEGEGEGDAWREVPLGEVYTHHIVVSEMSIPDVSLPDSVDTLDGWNGTELALLLVQILHTNI